MRIQLTHLPDGRVEVTVPMPPDYRFSFSGSGLPFPSESAAFEPSQVQAVAMTASGATITLPPSTREPNHYYLHGRYISPRARAVYTSGGETIDEMLPISGVRRVPGRSLTPAPRLLASTRPGPVVTQESLIRSTAMPSAPCLEKSV